MQRSEKEKIRKRNCKGETIYRNHNDVFHPIANPQLTAKNTYPWEKDSNLPKITKDFFRCKGNSQNPKVSDPENPSQEMCSDCSGGSFHGLPIIHDQEGIYPILLEQLNYIQKKTGKRVVITSGHRCPLHNSYIDPSKDNKTSKHQIGAEVDFYVQGMEDRPLEIVGLLMQYYQDTPYYQNAREYQTFTRYEKPDVHLAVLPWMNKEVYIKVLQKNEGRNLDNQHPHPYIAIQVRFDRKANERVVYDWQKANKGYSRSW